jgi:phospholysine phosphohistidine inorganic pyrophosphate phosphatase
VRAASPSAVLFDLDGVFFVGDQPIPGGAQTCAWLAERDVPMHFVTNTTSHPRSFLAAKLARMGIVVTEEQILTPVVAARELIEQMKAEPVVAFLPAGSVADLGRLRSVAPDYDGDVAAIVVGDLGESWDFRLMNQAFRHLMRQPAPLFVALGMSRFWADHDGLVLDVGPFVRALEFATDRQALVAGKPSPTFFAAAARHVGRPLSEVAMVGDDIRSDVEAAQMAGLCGVLVRTGKFTEADLGRGVTPDVVLDSVADLPTWWQAASRR